MKPNPGGILKGKAIVDREKEISSIWKALQNQSVLLSSERRVGKTSILRKIEENPMDNWVPILYWVEAKQHPIEFVEGLYEELLKKDLLQDKFYKLKKFYAKYVGGEQIGSWKLPQIKENWKPLLESMIEDIVASGGKVLLMLDEAIDFLLNDPNDEGFFRHYLDRIKTYYDKDIQDIALFLLDRVCKKEEYWKESDIITMVKSHQAIEEEMIKETLSLLWSDHYLIREIKNNQRTYCFRYSILHKWWKLNRG